MNPNRPDGGRTLAFATLIFLGLLAMEAGLLAAAVGRLPNDVAVPLVDQFAMLVTLWRSNPMAALPHLAQQAVLVIAHHEPATGQQVWGLYYYPLALVVHLAVAVVAARMLAAPMDRRRPALLASGGALLVLGVTYVRLAACCTVASRWALDIALLARAYDPTSTGLDWQALYARLEPAFPYLQAGTLVAGIGLSVAAWRRRPPATGD